MTAEPLRNEIVTIYSPSGSFTKGSLAFWCDCGAGALMQALSIVSGLLSLVRWLPGGLGWFLFWTVSRGEIPEFPKCAYCLEYEDPGYPVC